ASQRQRNTSGIALDALSGVETVTSAGPLTRMSDGGSVKVKEESVPDHLPASTAGNSSHLQRIPIASKYTDRVNYQRMRNEEMREHGSSRIDDQGIVFEGERGVTPVDEALRQYRLRSANPDHHPGGSEGSSSKDDDEGPPPTSGPNRNIGREYSRPPNPREPSMVPEVDRVPVYAPERRQTESPSRHLQDVEVTRRTPHRYTMPRDLETP
ncbi:hypothetical protein H0H93_001844, partial [Arthromyces matolae]